MEKEQVDICKLICAFNLKSGKDMAKNTVIFYYACRSGLNLMTSAMSNSDYSLKLLNNYLCFAIFKPRVSKYQLGCAMRTVTSA
jgi:hypothetical protein